ncbi:MAG TPA: enolase C-terminal domain-like protein [Terracidiphilus sp.]|nr:enolase C-terminal domain-like protein [Terracidiphilus sp.]
MLSPSLHPGAIERLEVETYKVPTELPESDGTLQWDHTNITIVTAYAQGQSGLGYTFAGHAAAELIGGVLNETVKGLDPMSPPLAYMSMWRRIRNMGRPGICSMAISAVDCALWDLKARLLEMPLVTLLGQVREAATVYGSGGFTSYGDQQLAKQLEGWARQGIGAVKMKIGRDPARDKERVRVARKAIGTDTKLYVDANGAYFPRQALEQAEMLAAYDVRWFEEPVSSDNLTGMRFVREHVGPRMNIAAGEYGYDIFYFREMLAAGAVDVLQADITRCGGVTGFMHVSALCEAHNVPFSAHTAPAEHTHAVCASIPFTEVEYFHDHVRIEEMFFDGLPKLVRGELRPDLSRPGNGLELRRKDAAKFAA